MPTINEVIERVDRVKANPYDDESKAAWLIELDGKLYAELVHGPLTQARGPIGGGCPACGSYAVKWTPGYDFNSCEDCGWTDGGQLPPMKWPEDGDKPLLVPAPYDNLYDLYLFAMIDFHNREYANYNNSMVMFDAAQDEFRKQYRRTHTPHGSGWFKNVM